MAWVDDSRWATPETIEAAQNTRAPNPAQYPEPPHRSRSYWIRDFQIDFEDDWINVVPPEEVDLAIIGSGITGAAAAYHVAQSRPDLKVAMFEARGLCTGATGRNGGHIGRPEVYNFRELAETFGTEEAVSIRRAARRNFDMMVGAIEEHKAADVVDLKLNGTMIVFEDEAERLAYLEDTEAARAAGLEFKGYSIKHDDANKASLPVVLLPAKGHSAVGFLWLFRCKQDCHMKVEMDPELAQHGAAYLDRSGTIHARKFVAFLLRTTLARMGGLTLHPYTPVWKVDYNESQETFKYTLTTSKGQTRARTVLHATNGYASHLSEALLGKDGVFGCGAHMLGIKPVVPGCETQLERSFGFADFWHWILQRPNHGPYLYGLANAESMGKYNDTLTLDKSHPIRGEMLAFLERAFPHAFKGVTEKDITHDWTGVQGFTNTGASIVGRPLAERRGEFASVGHNGEGMGRCFVCSAVVSSAILAELSGKRDWEAPEWFPKSYSRNLGPE